MFSAGPNDYAGALPPLKRKEIVIALMWMEGDFPCMEPHDREEMATLEGHVCTTFLLRVAVTGRPSMHYAS